MTRKILDVPSYIETDADALAVANQYADEIERLGGEIEGVRGMRAYQVSNDAYGRRADVVFGYSGQLRQISVGEESMARKIDVAEIEAILAKFVEAGAA